MSTPTESMMRPPEVGPEAGAAPARHRSLPSRRRGLFWAGVLAAVAALVVGGIVTVGAWVSESAPATAAVAYFHALGRGDAAGALGLGDVPPGVHSYLTSEVLQASLQVARIRDVHVLSVDRSGRTARVTVQYQLSYSDGSTLVTDSVDTDRRGRTWRLAKTAAPVHLQPGAAGSRMSIAGSAIPAGTVLLFPGALPVTLDTPNLTLGQLVVHLDGAVPSTIQPDVSPAGKRAVGQAVANAIRACINAQTSGPCPAPADLQAIPGSVRGAVTGDLADQLAIDVEPGADGLLHVTGTVDVSGSYQRLDFNNQPQHETGMVKLSIDARCYVNQPDRIVWGKT
jgi:hypothetical protein